jgi:hypothetical protein
MNKWICKESKQKIARYIIGKEGADPLVLFTLFPEEQSVAKWGKKIKKVIKLSEALDKDGWLIINIYPIKINNVSEINHFENMQLIYRNRDEIKELFNKYNVSTVWAGWGNAVQENDFLWFELKNLLKRIPEDTQWIIAGKLSKEGHPVFNGRAMNVSRMIPFEIEDYINKHKLK